MLLLLLLRQHTSAYVSIRQHHAAATAAAGMRTKDTRGYVLIRHTHQTYAYKLPLLLLVCL
jgi:hypothetical protein